MSGIIELAAESSLRITVVAAAVGAVLYVARIRPGALRHAVWTGTMAAMLLMPLLMNMIPQVGVPVWSRAVGSMAYRPVDAVEHVEPWQAAAVNVPTLTGTEPGVQNKTTGWWAVLFGTYVAGVVLLLARQIVGWWAMGRLVRHSEATVAGDTVVLESSAVTTAIACGVFRPRIVLPREWRDWPEEKLAIVLAHESAHIRRYDPLTGFVARFNCALFWFHPVAWWLERTIAAAAEQACDDAVIRTTRDPSRYAAVLLEIAESLRRAGARLSWIGIGMAGSGALSSRVERLLSDDVLKTTPRTRKAAVGFLCTAMAYLGAACHTKTPDQEHSVAVADLTPVAASQSTNVEVEEQHPLPQTPPIPPLRKSLDSSSTAGLHTAAKQMHSEATGGASTATSKPLRMLVLDNPRTLAEIVAEATTKMPDDVLRSKADKILADNDPDRDGIITRQEAVGANKALIFMWDQYDKNRDGTVTAAEVTRYTDALEIGTAVEKLGGDAIAAGLARKPTPETIITVNDLNGDGIATREEATKSGRATIRMWHLYDLNQDDRLDAAEVAKASGY